MSASTSASSSTPDPNIHRLLDEAFTGITMTAEAQDLKEEMRANLMARIAELQAAGVPAAEAARRAIAELGDIRSLIDEVTGAPGRRVPDAPWQQHRVSPKPAYAARTILFSLIGLAALGLMVVDLVPAAGVTIDVVAVGAAVAALAFAGAAIVADALRQETTANFPLPRKRSLAYGLSTLAGLAGLGIGAQYLRANALALLGIGTVLVVVSIAAFIYLGVTQTNRHKPWVVRLETEAAAADLFIRDPATAARFGLYTVAIWVVAVAAFEVLGFTVGWAWSWLALVAGFAMMMLVLGRMFASATPTTNQ